MKTALLLTLLLAGSAIAADPGTVTLRDGKVLEDAVIVRLNPATYIVQTQDKLYEFSGDELDPASMQEHNFKDKRPPITTHNYDEIHADGTATRYWTMPLFNDGRKAMTEIRMGLAYWERAMVDQITYVDNRGITLASTYDPPRKKWSKSPNKNIRHTLHLTSPLAPGESMTFTGSETSNRIRSEGEEKHYLFHGDYSEGRLVTLKVRLPQDAKINTISPKPNARFEHENCQYVMWKRYYQKGEVIPLEIFYTLDSRN